MLKLTKFLALSLCLSVILSFNVFASYVETSTEYDVPELDLSLTVPEGTYIFGSTTEDSDPLWEEAGIESAPEYKTIYQELGIVAHFSSGDGEINVLVNKTETDTTTAYFSFAHMSEQELSDFILEKLTVDEQGALTQSEVYEHSQIPFIRSETHVDLDTLDGPYEGYELSYFTMLNGYTVAFSHNSTEPIPEAVDLYLQELVDTVTFNNIEAPDVLTEEEIAQARLALIGMLIALVAIIAFFVYTAKRNKKRARDIKELANEISLYRAKRPEMENPQGELVFENFTELDEEIIKKYSLYKAYIQKPIVSVLPMLLTLVSFIATFTLDIDLLWVLLIFAAFIYCVYKYATCSYIIARTMRRAHSKYRSKKAHYRFYEKEFSISGLQFVENYPYFQITDFKDHDNYFFIYFGENNCYYVDKRKFTVAQKDDFKAFIKEKMGKKRIV